MVRPNKRVHQKCTLTVSIIIVMALLLGALNTAAGTATTSFTRWSLKSQCSGNETISAEAKSRSLIHCAVRCSRLRRCVRFGYDVTSGRCYVSVQDCGMTSKRPTFSEMGVTLQDIVCSGPCPHHRGYSQVGGECVKAYGEVKTFRDASLTCGQDGAHLYHVRRRLQDAAIINTVARDAGIAINAMWVGADDLRTEGSFRYSNGCPLDNESEVWQEGEPSDSFQSEDCAEFSADLLNDNNCRDMRPFVCQFD